MMMIETLPQSITRGQYLSLLTAAGFNSTDDLRLLEFRMDGIYAEFYDRNEQGSYHVDRMTGDPVMNRVFIPVKD